MDQIVCLGDVASLGPQPREVIARLHQLEIPIIMGNHDNYLLNPSLTENHHPWLRAAELWCVTQLTTNDLNYLGTFKPQIIFHPDPKTTLLCFHGSPRSNEEFLYPTTPAETLNEVFDGQSAQVLIGGHTHVQMVRQHKGMLFLNPGSVGQPRDEDPRDSYAIVDLDAMTFTLRRAQYDFTVTQKLMKQAKLPERLIRRLRFGQ